MAQYIFKGVDRYNQLRHGNLKFDGIVNVIDENDTLVIFTRDEPPSNQELERDNEKLMKKLRECYRYAPEGGLLRREILELLESCSS